MQLWQLKATKNPNDGITLYDIEAPTGEIFETFADAKEALRLVRHLNNFEQLKAIRAARQQREDRAN